MDCAFRNISEGSTHSFKADSTFTQKPGDVFERGGSAWIRNCEQCFTIWESATKNIITQGCWYTSDGCSSSCVSDGVVGTGLEFCCCSGDKCNEHFSSGEQRTIAPKTMIEQKFNLVSLTVEEESLLTYILLGVLTFLLVALIVVIWRISKTCDRNEKKKQKVLEISSSQILLIPPSSPGSSNKKSKTTPEKFYRSRGMSARLLPPSSMSSPPLPAFKSKSSYLPNLDEVPVIAPPQKNSQVHYPKSFSAEKRAAAVFSPPPPSAGLLKNLYPRLHMTTFMAQNLLLSHAKTKNFDVERCHADKPGI